MGPEYSVFVSMFHATKLVVRNWSMPSLDVFIDSLTQEKVKLIQMGTLNTSKDHVLAALENNNFKSKGKLKVKEKKPKSDSEDEGSYSIDEGLNSKRRETRKEDQSVPIAENLLTIKNISLKIIWTS